MPIGNFFLSICHCFFNVYTNIGIIISFLINLIMQIRSKSVKIVIARHDDVAVIAPLHNELVQSVFDCADNCRRLRSRLDFIHDAPHLPLCADCDPVYLAAARPRTT